MSREINVDVNIPQGHFLALDKKFRAFVGGYGSGKTYVGCVAVCCHIYEFPLVRAGYFAPTYPMIRDIFYPKIEAVAGIMGLSTKINLSNKEVHFYRGRKYRGTCVCRSMDNPGSIAGFEIGYALVDELDLMPTDKANVAWNNIIARIRLKREKLRNGVDVVTTPEGFKFTYRKFVAERTESYGIVHASTYENAKNLPSDYIPSLLETYPKSLVEAYINGQFVNLTSGTVYRQFNRAVHSTTETIKDGEPLFIGQDFNVGNMASVICANRAGKYHAVAELTGVMDTLHLCEVIKEKYPKSEITIFPDATGASRNTTDATKSDIRILRSCGFRVVTNESNPPIKDRVLAVNTAFEKGNLVVNVRTCPNLAKALEQQAYDRNGQPDKQSEFDHLNDALGYFVHKKLPIVKPCYGMAVR